MKTASEYLHDLLQELEDIAEFTREGYEAFESNRQVQKAVIKSYENIGEIVKRLPQHIREENSQVAWATLAGFRDFLIHNYDRILLGNVWAAVKDLPSLKAEIEKMLRDLAEDEID